MRLLSMAIFLLRVAHLTACEEDGPRVHALPGMARSTLSVHSVESFARLKACQCLTLLRAEFCICWLLAESASPTKGAGLTVKETHFAKRVGAAKANHSKPDVRRASPRFDGAQAYGEIKNAQIKERWGQNPRRTARSDGRGAWTRTGGLRAPRSWAGPG